MFINEKLLLYTIDQLGHRPLKWAKDASLSYFCLFGSDAEKLEICQLKHKSDEIVPSLLLFLLTV